MLKRMRITITAKPRAKREKIQRTGENSFDVWVAAPPEDGKANKAIAKLLAEELGITPSNLTLVSGKKGKYKVFELL